MISFRGANAAERERWGTERANEPAFVFSFMTWPLAQVRLGRALCFHLSSRAGERLVVFLLFFPIFFSCYFFCFCYFVTFIFRLPYTERPTLKRGATYARVHCNCTAYCARSKVNTFDAGTYDARYSHRALRPLLRRSKRTLYRRFCTAFCNRK